MVAGTFPVTGSYQQRSSRAGTGAASYRRLVFDSPFRSMFP